MRLSIKTEARCPAWVWLPAGYDGRATLSIFRTNFSDEFETLYRNRGDGNFDEVTLDAGLGKNTRYVGWGTAFFDFDNDGWTDLMLVNGHVFPEVEKLQIDIHYKDRPILYRSLGNGKFIDVSKESGPAFAEMHSARGAAFGDIDNDGAIEVAVNNQNEPPSLLKQSGKVRRPLDSASVGGNALKPQRDRRTRDCTVPGMIQYRRSSKRRKLSFAERSAAAFWIGMRRKPWIRSRSPGRAERSRF